MQRTPRVPVVFVISAIAALGACDGTSPSGLDAGTDAAGPEDAGGLDAGPRDDAGAQDDADVLPDAVVPDGGGALVVPETYDFESRFEPGASSVAYSGQVARQLLALDLGRFIEDLGEAIGDCGDGPYDPRDLDADGTPETMAETVLADIALLFDAPTAARHARAHDAPGLPAGTTATPATYGEISMTAYIREKVAGNDASTDHRDWTTEFVGFRSTAPFRALPGETVDVSSPTGLLTAIFTTVAMNAEDAYACRPRTGPGGVELPVHVSDAGHDLAELVEKILFGAMNFSQGLDDYLDDEPEDVGKGLLAPNTRDGAATPTPQPYTTLEHHWDEGYGYFGAPRHASRIPLDMLVGSTRGFDANGDMTIDVRSEYLFPLARYAALREARSAAAARTPFFTDAERAFRTGRAIIAASPEGETLAPETLAALREQRDIIARAWEGALAASTISYINRVIQQTLAIDTPGMPVTYDFAAHAGAWSEMKGFALSFQFHRRSPMLVREGGEERFVTLHGLLGDRPVTAAATASERAAYVADLIAARTLIGNAFGFDPANLGDEMGRGGW